MKIVYALIVGAYYGFLLGQLMSIEGIPYGIIIYGMAFMLLPFLLGYGFMEALCQK